MPCIAPLGRGKPDIAEWHNVPQEPITTLEHIGVIKDLDKAIQCFGGEKPLNAFLISTAREKAINLQLNPHDPLRRGIPSAPLSTSNAILKVSVPKRTGRKRKRGSDDPFTVAAEGASQQDDRLTDVGVMLRSMRDNPAKCKVQPVGLADETYRFRDLPDFKWSTMTSRTAKDFQEKLLPLNWSKLKHFHIDVDTKGDAPDIDMIPPPVIVREGFPHQYQYTQNTYVRTIHTPGAETTSVNRSAVPKKRLQMIKYATRAIPAAASPALPSESVIPEYARRLIATIRGLFEKRPIMTRRVLYNSLPSDVIYDVPYAVQYVAYQFSSGPWKDAMIRFGVDPRHEPECRFYQTIALRGHKHPQLFASAFHPKTSEAQVNADDEPGEEQPLPVTITKPSKKKKRAKAPMGIMIAGKGARIAAKQREKEEAIAANATPSRWHWRRDFPATPNSAKQAGDAFSPGANAPQPNQNSPNLTNYTTNRLSHIFNGAVIDPTMHTWQVCDVTDPQIAFLLKTPPRESCDIACDGWFLNGAWAKARVVMREKLKVCKLGGVPNPEDYAKILAIPDHVGEWNWKSMMIGGATGKGEGRVNANVTSHELEMASSVRQLCGKFVKVSRGRGVEADDFEVSESEGEHGQGVGEDGHKAGEGQRGDISGEEDEDGLEEDAEVG